MGYTLSMTLNHKVVSYEPIYCRSLNQSGQQICEQITHHIIIVMYHCEHDYCPHLHYKKCLTARVQSIPYTIFPDGSIDSFTNVPMRCAKLYKSNIPTMAYQNYTLAQGASDADTNFVRNYYLDSNNQGSELVNEIVKEQEELMCTQSAYLLAGVEARKFEESAQKTANDLENARRRATARSDEHFRALNHKKNTEKTENAKWLKKLYRNLEEVSRTIIEGEGVNLSERQKQFLLSKQNLTANYLSQIKVRNPKAACEMLEELRTLMLKKKLRFEEQRQEQDYNKSATMSFMDESGVSNTSQNSMLSEATSLNESNMFGEDQVINKYCDFEEMKKKWRTEDITQVRQILRRMLTRKIVSEAEVKAARNRQQAKKNDDIIRQSLQRKGQTVQKKTGVQRKAVKSVHKDKGQVYLEKTNMKKQEIATKETLVNGGQFDAIGQKFSRNRNYGEMFKNRQDANTIQFLYKDKSAYLRDCCCTATG